MSSSGFIPGVTTAPYDYLVPQGVIVPDTSDLQTEVENEMIEALDAPDLDLSPSTVQGGLIQAETLSRSKMVANNCALANQINPDVAGGIFLQAICAMTGLSVPAATNTIVRGVTVGGAANLVIPVGSQAQQVDNNGNPNGVFFQTLEQVTLSPTGTGTVDFQAVTNGPVACPIGTLTRVSGTVLGWETVYNSSAPAASDIGTLVPSDAQIRQLRNNTLGLQGQGLSYAVTSAVNNTPGVIGPCVYRENNTASDATIQGVLVKARTIYLCVQGGDNVQVATSIWQAKGGGCGYTVGGNPTTVTLLDPNSGQLCPVTYDRPIAVPLIAQITVVLPNSTYTANDVQQALVDYQAGLIDAQQGFTMGAPASPFDMAAAIVAEIPGVVVNNLQIGLKTGGTLSPSQINCAPNQIFTLAVSDMTVIASTGIVNS